MKENKNKMLLRGLAVALAVALVTTGGTFAYLQSSTGDRINTFSANKIDVKLTETTGESYNIKPGTEQAKDPKVAVDNTVDAYVYVEITDETEGLVGYEIAEGWQLLDGTDNIYWREVSASADVKEFSVLKGDKVTYGSSLENSDMLDEEGQLKTGITLTLKAYAMQKEPFTDAAAAYNRIPLEASDVTVINSALSSGKDVRLTGNLTNVTINPTNGKTATLDLNGHDVAGIRMAYGNRCAIKASGTGTVLTVEGEGLVDGRGYSSGTANAVKAETGGKVIINGGTYTTGLDYNGNPNSVVLVNVGTVEINGGFFYNYGNGSEWVLNCQDNTDSHIIVKGGTFVNFNPADNSSEGAGTNYVAEGYKVLSETKDSGDIWYTVVKA